MSEAIETPTGETSAEFVDLNAITDAEQLRDVINNPGKFTTEKPGEKEEKPEGGDLKPEGEKPKGEGTVEKPEGEQPEVQHSKNRVKVRIAHLPESQQEVLKLVSLGKSIHEAQGEVVTGLVRAGKTLREAEAEVFGESGNRRVETGKEERPETGDRKPESEKPDPIVAKQNELEGLRAELDKAEDAYDIKQSRILRDKIDDLKWEIRELKDSAKKTVQTKEQAEAQKIVDAVAESTARAIELFPDAENEGTELFEAIQDAVEDARETNPAFFLNPRWPITLAAEKAAELGIPSSKHKGGATSQQGEQPQRPPTKQARQIVPASGTSGGSVSKPTDVSDPTADLEAAGNDPEKLMAYLKKYGRRDISRLSPADAFASAA